MQTPPSANSEASGESISFLQMPISAAPISQVFQFQLYSLSSVPPHQQKIFGAEQDTPVVNDSDLVAISDKLQLVLVNDSEPEPSAADLLKSDEELARLLQAEEEALMLQQYVASQNP
ncbi:hypothetical protein JHK82_033888 [Glycine max]|nr:hypothetical protein JHK86_033970 [Glycine max]KAG5119468.1 hypothetical protein JHK82_033888 [Glycine max]KAG5140460.1 hypothetical protein JHK84_034228 [Glycine max]